ncbi:MAG: hypothetical protein CMI18_02895 [Opitutaceae bacterium]|nr:hypothetical protein [Opitutaceae bacterium]
MRRFSWLILFLGYPQLFGQPETQSPLVVAYTSIRQPQFLESSLSERLSETFNRNPFSVFLIYNRSGPRSLGWVLATNLTDSDAWRTLAEERSWRTLDWQTYRLFSMKGSNVLENGTVLSSIQSQLQVEFNGAMDGGLMPSWNLGLQDLRENLGQSERLASDLPFTREMDPTEFASYVQWWAEEISGASFSWDVQLSRGQEMSTLTLISVPGTRPYRFIDTRSNSDFSVIDYVPAKSESLAFSRFHGSRAINLLNHIFDGTELLGNEPLIAARAEIEKFETSFFDRWDGSAVRWKPNDSEGYMLMLGGDFLRYDMNTLFQMLASISLDEFGVSMVLDEDNLVVGLTLIRSLELFVQWSDEEELFKRTFYFGIANGFLVIAEDSTVMASLIFRLNSKRTENTSARNGLGRNIFLLAAFFEGNRLSRSIETSNGRLIYKQTGSVSRFHIWIARFMKNLVLQDDN